MSSTRNTRFHQCRVRPVVVALCMVTVMGCQTAGHRATPHRAVDANQPPGHGDAGQSNPAISLSPSAADTFCIDADTNDAIGLFPDDSESVPVSQPEAHRLFNSLKGKLRANDDGVIVEADLAFSDVTDEHLGALEAFLEIRELDLTGTQVHDQGLAVLPKLQQLQALKLKGTRITSDGMLLISQLPTLVLLDASNTDVSDEGLAMASQWTSLRYLSLNNTTVSDASIAYLQSLETLKGLSLLNTNVTADGIRILKEALPNCLIVTKAENEIAPSAIFRPVSPVGSPRDNAMAAFPAKTDTQLEQVVQLAQQQPQVAVHLASIYSSKEQWTEAVQVLSAAAAVDPKDRSLQLSLGAALARAGNSQAAKSHLTQAVGAAAANYNIGLIEYEKNLQSCANHFQQAVQEDPSLIDAQARLREVEQELSDLRRQQMPIHSVNSRNVLTIDDTPMEVIPAPPVHAASFPKSWPRHVH